MQSLPLSLNPFLGADRDPESRGPRVVDSAVRLHQLLGCPPEALRLHITQIYDGGILRVGYYEGGLRERRSVKPQHELDHHTSLSH